MAEGATRAKGVPEGLPVGWIAPEGAIMDLGDLAEMRDALRVGKHVTVASDGHVYVSAEPTGQPMTPEAETFIEAKLGADGIALCLVHIRCVEHDFAHVSGNGPDGNEHDDTDDEEHAKGKPSSDGR